MKSDITHWSVRHEGIMIMVAPPSSDIRLLHAAARVEMLFVRHHASCNTLMRDAIARWTSIKPEDAFFDFAMNGRRIDAERFCRLNDAARFLIRLPNPFFL